jgi:hypothetical protein
MNWWTYGLSFSTKEEPCHSDWNASMRMVVMLASVDRSNGPAPGIETVGKTTRYCPMGWSSLHYGIVIDV